MTPTPLKNRRALVTGSVQGIGLAMAQELARAGAQVVLHGLPNEAVHAAARESLSAITAQPVVSLAHDLADPAQVARMMDEVLTAGPLDILVNNAGIQHTAALPGPVHTLFPDANAERKTTFRPHVVARRNRPPPGLALRPGGPQPHRRSHSH